VSPISIVSLVALGLIWAGYPIAVAVLAALRRDHEPSGSGELPAESVSVILASCESAATIRARVSDLFCAAYPADRLQVVVALDVARARVTPADLADLDPRARVVVGDEPGGKAATLNAAIRAARHDVLVFADSAQRFDRATIAELVRSLRDSRLACVSGMLDSHEHGRKLSLSDRYWRYERWLRKHEARLYSGVGVTGAVYAMRKSLWAPLPAGLILDDVFVPMRLALSGWRIGFNEKARALDSREFDVAGEYRRKVRTLTGVLQLCAWLPKVLNPVSNPLWIQFTFHKLLRLATPYLLFVAAADIAWHTGRAVMSSDSARPVLAITFAIAVIAAVIPALRRRIAGPIVWGWALQRSIVVATVNGLRGRWDVWQ
jgi:cellulose synthase/poly-beta-1,6-N-acetylglucosamine synthase-like glycosyltransferase